MKSNSSFQLAGVFTRLIPFIVAVVVFFTDFIPKGSDVIGVLLKCLPILCLIIFVGLQTNNYEKEHKWFCYIVMCGLFFGAIGDFLLYIDYFVIGAGFFAIGHIFYSIAYGFRPIAWILATVCCAFVIGFSIYIVPKLDIVLMVGLPIYGLVIVTMLWRAGARLYSKEEWSWPKWFTVFGGLNFVVSDAFIAIDMFVVDVPHSHYIIMSTYYVAQLGMAISVLDPRVPKRINNILKCSTFSKCTLYC